MISQQCISPHSIHKNGNSKPYMQPVHGQNYYNISKTMTTKCPRIPKLNHHSKKLISDDHHMACQLI